MTVGFDPLCSEGEAYAERLRAAGGTVTYRHLPGQIHGFITMGKIIEAAGGALDDAGAALAQAFAG
jgi:acetyl esterase